MDGAVDSEQELNLPLGYKWAVWDHTNTKVKLTQSKHTITLAAKSLDGEGTTQGDAVIRAIRLSRISTRRCL